MSVTVPSLRHLAHRAVPQALEAAVSPAVLYLVAGNFLGPRAAMLAPLGWAVGAISWRGMRAIRVPGMMVLALFTLPVRSVLAFAADDRPRNAGRADALAERRSDQGVRVVWPGPASIR